MYGLLRLKDRSLESDVAMRGAANSLHRQIEVSIHEESG